MNDRNLSKERNYFGSQIGTQNNKENHNSRRRHCGSETILRIGDNPNKNLKCVETLF